MKNASSSLHYWRLLDVSVEGLWAHSWPRKFYVMKLREESWVVILTIASNTVIVESAFDLINYLFIDISISEVSLPTLLHRSLSLLTSV